MMFGMSREYGRLSGRMGRWWAPVLVAGLVTSVQAAFVAPATWTRGQADTTYQEWNIFTSPAGPNVPDVGVFNPNGTPNVTESSGSSFVTGGGNIYSFNAVLDIDVTVPDYNSPGSVTTVILQTRSQGSEIDYGTIKIGGLGFVDQAELDRVALGGQGGYGVEKWFKFELPTSSAGFTIEFQATESSMSLDRLAVDTITSSSFAAETNPVPEPATCALLLAGVAWLRTRRGRNLA